MELKVTKDQLKNVAEKILTKSQSVNVGGAVVIALSGDLGSGKTTLTQEMAQQVGITENVISPTFIIMKIYEIKNARFQHFIHIDAYRLHTSEELLKLGWQELLADPANLIVIEWPEQVPECIPVNACKLELTHVDEETRIIRFI